MRQEQLDNLIKFRDGVRTLAPEEFRFDRVVTEYDPVHECGTICCSIGWLPRFFPTHFKWQHLALNLARVQNIYGEPLECMFLELFGLTGEQYYGVFHNRRWALHGPRPYGKETEDITLTDVINAMTTVIDAAQLALKQTETES